MTDANRRLVGATCFLAALWVLVYWLWQPAPPGITFAGGPAPASRLPAAPPDRMASEPSDRSRPSQAAPSPIRDPLEEGSAQPLTPGPRPTAPQPSLPTFRDYTIREGDTFERIAARELGSASLAEAIARANPLKDPRRLRIGEVIRLPRDPTITLGPTSPSGNAPGTPETSPTPGARQAVANGPITYTVEAGDSLSRISQLFYGTVRHASLIFEANRDQLRSMDDVRAGQVIRIPPKPAP